MYNINNNENNEKIEFKKLNTFKDGNRYILNSPDNSFINEKNIKLKNIIK